MDHARKSARTDSTGRARAGSQKQIQTYVNERAALLNAAIARSLLQHSVAEDEFRWVSPLAADSYAEYQDSEFLERVGFGQLAPILSNFWPRRGPCWDAMAQIRDGCVLVEAKSHVDEIYGSGCGASEKSAAKIRLALDATKTWLGVAPDLDWMSGVYQSANRFAALYFLREVARVRAFLVNIYFLGDPISKTSLTEERWQAEITNVNKALGLARSVPFTSSVFLSV